MPSTDFQTDRKNLLNVFFKHENWAKRPILFFKKSYCLTFDIYC